MAHCLIPGCRLFVHHGPQSVWGDLHACCDDTIFVFDAVKDRWGSVAWDYSRKLNSEEKSVVVLSDDYVERHGIFTFSAGDAMLSKAATEYLSSDPTWKKT